jgi:hypothetical protein
MQSHGNEGGVLSARILAAGRYGYFGSRETLLDAALLRVTLAVWADEEMSVEESGVNFARVDVRIS